MKFIYGIDILISYDISLLCESEKVHKVTATILPQYFSSQILVIECLTHLIGFWALAWNINWRIEWLIDWIITLFVPLASSSFIYYRHVTIAAEGLQNIGRKNHTVCSTYMFNTAMLFSNIRYWHTTTWRLRMREQFMSGAIITINFGLIADSNNDRTQR